MHSMAESSFVLWPFLEGVLTGFANRRLGLGCTLLTTHGMTLAWHHFCPGETTAAPLRKGLLFPFARVESFIRVKTRLL